MDGGCGLFTHALLDNYACVTVTEDLNGHYTNLFGARIKTVIAYIESVGCS